MVVRERYEGRRMTRLDWQNEKSVGLQLAFEEVLVGLIQLVLADADFDSDSPVTGWTYQYLVVFRSDRLKGRREKSWIVEHKP